MNTIIFDFNRTLFDPERGALFPGALELLARLRAAGHTLHLVSRLEPGREAILGELGVAGLFAEVLFVPDKEAALARLVREAPGPVYVVGDHLHQEIRIGNRLGAKTVWIAEGRFAELAPETEYDYPWRTVRSIREVCDVFFGP